MAAARSHASSKIRGMGCHEAYQLAMHTLDMYRGTIVTCRYSLPAALSRPEALATLKAKFCDALVRIVLDQPHLQVGIIGEKTKNPAFVSLDRLDLQNHVQWITLDDASHFRQRYFETIHTELDAKYTNISTQPGWRVVVLHKFGAELEVLYVWNHTHHDGSSGRLFHVHLLRYLNEMARQDKEPIVDVQDDSSPWILDLPAMTANKLPPNPEILTSWPMSPGFAFRELWNEFKPAFLPRDTHAHWAPIRATPYKTRFLNFTLDTQLVSKVVAACRLHNTTLTGLLQSLVLISLSSALPSARGFASRTPYDLRHILPSHTKKYPHLDPKSSMCNYVSVVDSVFPPALVTAIRSHMPPSTTPQHLPAQLMDTVWSTAAAVRNAIKTRLASGMHNDIIAIMKLCPDWNAHQRGELRRARFFSWLVTNLGVLGGEEGTEEGGWGLRRAELILSAETPSAALSVSVVTVAKREMCVTCSWQEGVVEEGVGEQLMGDLERWMTDIGASMA
ncbi:hypothetical protein EJ04DRAFT_295495 [Polyplosphaeria fusca]|uniref:Alcohol acetyltransferase n=1 Tax=Polyplosphaeria fusca TaxID=682080 RepID=A0A9P4V051_9PLEO|nr:hypothetical protein EJ04DRAFT_295495 [Polyplosphaeria fusca]